MSLPSMTMVATQWNHLPNIHATKPLSAAERTCLDDVRDVLARHGCLDRFGVTMLHKHFEMADDEILVEQADEAARRLVTKPVKVALVQAEMPTAYETQWHWRRDAMAKSRKSATCAAFRATMSRRATCPSTSAGNGLTRGALKALPTFLHH